MTYDYFYGQQAEMFAFYRVPKVLFTEDCFWNVSTDAKLLYGILLDRMNLSARNGWLDEEGRVYIIFTIEEIKGALGCAEKKAVKLLDELEKKCGLIERKRQGLGKPNLIYVKNFISGSVERQFLNCQKDNSGVVKNTIQELSKAQCNNTDSNYIDLSDTDPIFPSGFCGKEVDETDEFTRYYQYFYEQLSMDYLKQDYPYDHEILDLILHLIVEIMCSNRKQIRIASDDTKELQKCNLNELPKGELAILQLISTRLFVAVGDPHRYAETVIELDCGGTAFSAKGKTILHDGWKALARKSVSAKSDEKEQALPSVSVGDEIAIISTEIKEGKTSPPKHYTEDTLLQSMETAGADEMPDEVERKGLGTPATRAGIIEKLVRIGFLERKGDKKTKHLIPTHKGTALVTVMPEQIQSPSMTADWEEKLLLIEKGEYASEDFMDEIKDVIAGLIQNYEVIRDSEVLMSKESNAVGKCPVCGSPVEEKAKAFFCSNRSCKFALWKNNRYFESIGKSMTSATAQKLLGSGKIKLKGCKSAKTGNTFDATVYMEVFEDGKTRFNMEFDNGGKRK